MHHTVFSKFCKFRHHFWTISGVLSAQTYLLVEILYSHSLAGLCATLETLQIDTAGSSVSTRMVYLLVALAAVMFLSVPDISRYYYELLDLASTATQAEIRNAYRTQALRWHPDKNTDSQATARFRKIAEAYEVLSSKGQSAPKQRWHQPPKFKDPNVRAFARWMSWLSAMSKCACTALSWFTSASGPLPTARQSHSSTAPWASADASSGEV